MKTAIVIPTYNEAETISGLVEKIRRWGTPIVVDDLSTDGSGDIAERAGAVVVRHSVNGGYDRAIQSGFEKADALGMELVATMDADGQHSPDLLGRFISPIENGEVEMVLGIRPRPARPSERLFNMYAWARFGVRDILCGMKAYGIELYRENGRFDGSGSIGTELALFGLRKQVGCITVPVPISPRWGSSRFGARFGANYRILRALMLGMWEDIRMMRVR